jgi:hypothetical protein
MPERFFKPAYVGAKGWLGVRLDARTDLEELAAILRDGYLMSAPVKLHIPRFGVRKKTAVASRPRSGLFQFGAQPWTSRRRSRPIS